MSKKTNTGKSQIMVDYAWQDKRSSHAILRGYGDGRDRVVEKALLEQELLSKKDIDAARGEPMSREDAHKHLKSILFHMSGIASMTALVHHFWN